MAGPAAAAQPPAGAAAVLPEHVETDAATKVQLLMDELMLGCFNALLDVSKASGAAGARAGGPAASPQVAQAAQTGVVIGRRLRELGEAIEALPQLPPPEEEGVTSVEAARRRLKALEGEYRLIHREMVEAVEEAGLLSARLRKAVSSSSAAASSGGGD